MKNTDLPFTPAALTDVLERLGLLSGASLKIGFSGGLDSTVLLHALCRVRDTQPLTLRALHVDHALHPDSAAWAERARRTCDDWGVPCTVERVRVTRRAEQGTEAAARGARYACLARYIDSNEVLLTAHHADDQAETVLLQLLRGAGVHGLAAMPMIIPFHRGRLARPLLEFSRAQLAQYAAREGVGYIDDPSNAETRFARNYLRHTVLPLMEARWPGAARRMAHAAGTAAEAGELLDELAAADLARCHGATAVSLSVEAVRRLSAPRQRNLIRYWLRQRGFLAPDAAHLEQVLRQTLREARTRRALVRWPGAEVRRYRDEITVQSPGDTMDLRWESPWNLDDPLEIPGIGLLRAEPATGAGLSRERIEGAPLRVALRQGGERCRLPGRAHRHKLKKLLQEAGIPPWERRRLPLIYVDDELAAVGDRWVCEPYAAHANEPGWKLRLILTPEMRAFE